MSTSEHQPTPIPATTSKRKHVAFSQDIVAGTTEAPSYDRGAISPDIFSCDACGLRIPSGIRGFEPYGTCEICEDGFDLCGACCGTAKILQLCCRSFVPEQTRPTLQVSQHQHTLYVMDWAAEVYWANGVAATTPRPIRSLVQKTRYQPRGRSKTPKKKKPKTG